VSIAIDAILCDAAHVYWTHEVPGVLLAVVHSKLVQKAASFFPSFMSVGPYGVTPPPELVAVASGAMFVLLHALHAPLTQE
jgi:hypothetical protein